MKYKDLEDGVWCGINGDCFFIFKKLDDKTIQYLILSDSSFSHHNFKPHYIDPNSEIIEPGPFKSLLIDIVLKHL